jgi:Type II CAAX prenyl endopeptidase Rce1-like
MSAAAGKGFLAKPGGATELVLTLPVFLAYQLGVVFLGVRNATDLVTSRLLAIVHGDLLAYMGLTGGIGLATVAFFAVIGRGQALRPAKLAQIVLEGAAYAGAMSLGTSWVVGKLFAGVRPRLEAGPLPGLVMSLGAGFYEELAFRVVLFGLGAKLLAWLFAKPRVGAPGAAQGLAVVGLTCAWALASAAVFSGMHYVGALGDAFDIRSFVARAVLGLALTLVYSARGFAAAVWTHALYDISVLVL